jgi:hypothetical protein
VRDPSARDAVEHGRSRREVEGYIVSREPAGLTRHGVPPTVSLDTLVADVGLQAVADLCVAVDHAHRQDSTKIVHVGEVHDEAIFRRPPLAEALILAFLSS